jgi:hypothetical protein
LQGGASAISKGGASAISEGGASAVPEGARSSATSDERAEDDANSDLPRTADDEPVVNGGVSAQVAPAASVNGVPGATGRRRTGSAHAKQGVDARVPAGDASEGEALARGVVHKSSRGRALRRDLERGAEGPAPSACATGANAANAGVEHAGPNGADDGPLEVSRPPDTEQPDQPRAEQGVVREPTSDERAEADPNGTSAEGSAPAADTGPSAVDDLLRRPVTELSFAELIAGALAVYRLA